MTVVSGLAAWAEAYAALGWRVFPAIGKKPAFAGWQEAATTDTALIHRWWPQDDGSNVALATGDPFDVFDIEREHLDGLRDRVLPRTPTALSGRGGLHFFTRPVGIGGTRRLVLDGTHVGELKSKGGLVIVPPSTTTIQYRWLYAPAGMPLAEAPGWMTDMIVEPSPPPAVTADLDIDEQYAALEALASFVAHQERGNRNAGLFWAARRALETGISTAATYDALTRAAEAAGLLSDDGGSSVHATLRSALWPRS
jgi:hypothetical protein